MPDELNEEGRVGNSLGLNGRNEYLRKIPYAETEESVRGIAAKTNVFRLEGVFDGKRKERGRSLNCKLRIERVGKCEEKKGKGERPSALQEENLNPTVRAKDRD